MNEEINMIYFMPALVMDICNRIVSYYLQMNVQKWAVATETTCVNYCCYCSMTLRLKIGQFSGRYC